MTIKELEERTGMDRGTIRFYEKEWLLAPERQANGYRDYSEEDAETLEKIAFLRQLGLSIEIIRAVQTGELPLGIALERQDETLLARREETDRALEISRAVRAEGASYQTLQPQKYKAQLPPPEWIPRVIPPAAPPKHYATKHPWRRLLARELDMALYTLPWWVAMIWLGLTNLSFWICSALAMLLLPLLLESLLLCTWGTTPGKWLMGLHLRKHYVGEVCKPTFRDAFSRTLHVYAVGYGFGFLTTICGVLAYLRANRGDDQPWDFWWEYTAEEEVPGSRAAVLLAALAVLHFAQNKSMDLSMERVNERAKEQAIQQGEYVPTLQEFVDSVNLVLAEHWMFEDYRQVTLNYDGTWNGLPEELRGFVVNFIREGSKFRAAYVRAEFPGTMEGVRPDGMEIYSALMLGLHEARGYRGAESGTLSAGSFQEIGSWNGEWGATYRLEPGEGLEEFFTLDLEGYRPIPGKETPDLIIHIQVGKIPNPYAGWMGGLGVNK